MHFFFFTCEVKCNLAKLDIADWQNLHNIILAIRDIVELFRLTNCAHELHREVLAFSIFYDYEIIRIYEHFPIIEGTRVTYWRHVLRKYDFTKRKSMKKWIAFTFATNVYNIWMSTLLKMIFSIIDDLRPKSNLESFLELKTQILETFELL